jgi:hypothetical protein
MTARRLPKHKIRRRCAICRRRVVRYAYDNLEVFLGMTKAEARRCEKCA